MCHYSSEDCNRIYGKNFLCKQYIQKWCRAFETGQNKFVELELQQSTFNVYSPGFKNTPFSYWMYKYKQFLCIYGHNPSIHGDIFHFFVQRKRTTDVLETTNNVPFPVTTSSVCPPFKNSRYMKTAFLALHYLFCTRSRCRILYSLCAMRYRCHASLQGNLTF